MLSGVIPAAAGFAWSPGKVPRMGEFLTKAGIDRIRSGPVSTTKMLSWLDNRLHEVCLQHRSELSFRGVHTEGRQIGIGHISHPRSRLPGSRRS